MVWSHDYYCLSHDLNTTQVVCSSTSEYGDSESDMITWLLLSVTWYDHMTTTSYSPPTEYLFGSWGLCVHYALVSVYFAARHPSHVLTFYVPKVK